MMHLSGTAAFLLLAATSSWAAPTIACHCFRDRVYDSSRPQAADPYILATTQSSLISAAFRADKRALVKARMTGTSAEDLWIAHWTASKSGLDSAPLLQARKEKASWKAALAAAGVDSSRLGPSFARLLFGGADDELLAAEAADDVLKNRVGVDTAVLAAVRAAGASTPETILACLLGRRLGVPPPDLYKGAKRDQESWGAILERSGLAPGEIDEVVRAALK